MLNKLFLLGMPSEPEIPQDVSISEELLMNIQRLRRSSSPELPDTVTKLETPEGCKVYVVGTAHFSKESQDDVAKVIPFHLYFYKNNNCSLSDKTDSIEDDNIGL